MNGSALAWLLDMACLSLGPGRAREPGPAGPAGRPRAEALVQLREKEEAVQLAANQQLATRAAELERAYDELRDQPGHHRAPQRPGRAQNQLSSPTSATSSAPPSPSFWGRPTS